MRCICICVCLAVESSLPMDTVHKLYAHLGKIIASSTTIDEIISGIMREIEIFFNPEHWSLLRVDDQSDELFFVAIKGTLFDKVKNIRLRIGEGIAGKVVLEKKSRFVPDTDKEPNFSRRVDEATGFHTKSIIAVPLLFGSHIFGVIEVVNKLDGGTYTVEDHLILRTIADFSAIAFHNNKMYEDMKEMAFHDSLTGVYNRAKLNKIIEERSSLNSPERRKSTPGTSIVFILDLDKFKEINDSHSHRGGDKVLKDIAQRLSVLIRSTDKVFRVGGDEFMILLEPEGDPASAIERVSESLKTILNESPHWSIPYSFCWGMATGPRSQLEEIIHEADLQMYKQKR